MPQIDVQRIVFPSEFELPAPAIEIQQLYFRVIRERAPSVKKSVPLWAREPAPAHQEWPPPVIRGRSSVVVPKGTILSTDAYFNRVHAAYWSRWTDINSLTVRLVGEGRARMAVRRSRANGYETSIVVVEGDLASGLVERVDVTSLAGGGTLWVDVEPLEDDVVITEGVWSCETDRELGKTDIAVCTYNRPADVAALVRSFGADPACSEVIERLIIVDNGSQSFLDEPGISATVEAWGDRLVVIRQENLGGSGGFARGQFEAAYRGSASFVTLLDDDVVVEPEGLRRAVVLASLARRPTAVGGQMLNRASPRILHAGAEWVDTRNMRYDAAPGAKTDVDVSQTRQEYALDAAYNAWWFCLIPTDAIRKLGLGVPFFIKYDDVEYGYRLARGGVRTVTLPGTAVWHEPFTLKDDTTDWTLYFHVRNRLIFTALMSADLPKKIQKRRLNAVIGDILKRDVLRNVLRRAYASAASAELAMSDFLKGPTILEEPLQEAVKRVRAARANFPDSDTARPARGRGDRPTSMMRTEGPRIPLGLPKAVLREFGVPIPKILPIPPALLGRRKTADAWQIWQMSQATEDLPELPKVADHWWGLAEYPEAWVTSVEGGTMTRRQRSPRLARELTRSGWRTAQEVKESFADLAEEYAAAAPGLTSPQTWAKQFGIEVDE